MQNTMNTYPTALVLLREISNHLGLKAYTKLSDEIDEHISNPHYPHYFEDKFIKALFTKQYFSAQLAQFLVHDTKTSIKDFYSFQRTLAFCGHHNSIDEADFIGAMISVKILPFIKNRLINLGLIPNNTKSRYLAAVFTAYKPTKKINKEMQDRIRIEIK